MRASTFAGAFVRMGFSSLLKATERFDCPPVIKRIFRNMPDTIFQNLFNIATLNRNPDLLPTF